VGVGAAAGAASMMMKRKQKKQKQGVGLGSGESFEVCVGKERRREEKKGKRGEEKYICVMRRERSVKKDWVMGRKKGWLNELNE